MTDKTIHNKEKQETSKLAFLYSAFKWLVLILSYGFLFYKLYTFDNYSEFKSGFIQFFTHNLQWLVFVLILLTVNWFLEAYKWIFLCMPFEKLTIGQSFKSVLSGLATGFLSPNRIGEIIGRPMYLKKENRISGALMTVVNGFSQTITIVACGIPSAFLFFFYSSHNNDYKQYIYFCICWFLLFLMLYFKLPGIARWFSKRKITQKIRKELDILSGFSIKRLAVVFIFSFVRYVVFCLQFYLLLLFCNVHITPFEALIAITLNYLFVTITPSMSFSEVVIRTSYAVFFIGYFSDNIIGITITGVLLWIINFVFPMLIGSFFFAKTKI